MNGFSWVRVDRAIDHSAPLKLLARAMKQDTAWALGVYVRTRLVAAGRFPDGFIRLSAAHLELELDVPDGTAQAMVAAELLVQHADGFEVPGWQDDPAVREVLNKRVRASGRPILSQGVPQAATGGVAGLSQGVPQPVAGGTAATPQAVAGGDSGLSQAATGGTATDMTDMTNMTDSTDSTDTPQRLGGALARQLPTAFTEVSAIVLDAWPPEKRCNPRAVVMAIRQDNATPDAHTCRRIAEAARAWVAAYTAQDRAQYLPRLDNWISAGSWREAPPAAPVVTTRRARTKNGEVALTHDDMTAIIAEMKAAEAASQNTKGQDDEQFPF